MVYLVYGAPCSGKSRYISEHMERGDIVCDVDSIYAAISGQDPHDADLHVHEIALKLKDELLDTIRDRNGNWGDAYVTSIANTREKLQKHMARVNADECIFVDTPYEDCMSRAAERPSYFALLIQEWFDLRSF